MAKNTPAPAKDANGEKPVKRGKKTRHGAVLERLIAEIEAGRFAPGGRLPTEQALAEMYSASKSTVARAMRELKRRGVLNRQRGQGTHLAQTKTKRIALFAPRLGTPGNLGSIGTQVYTHLADIASKRGDHMRLQFTERHDSVNTKELFDAAQQLIDQGTDGVLFYPDELPAELADHNRQLADRLQEARVATVCIDRDLAPFPDRSPFPLVIFDNRQAGYLVTRHVISQGCRRIAFVNAAGTSTASADRLRGYFDAIVDSDLPFDRNLVCERSLGALDADFCQTLLEDLKPDAIICRDDRHAAMLGGHLMARGCWIGRDIKLAGFEDEQFATLLPVPLTSVRFSAAAMAAAAYERLVRQIEHPEELHRGTLLIDAELVPRASTLPG